jgi:hypothetical protein
MNTIKEYIMITFAALAFMILTGVAKADTNTTSVSNFLSTLASIPGKVVNHVKSEAESIKAYQSNSWAEMKQKWPFKQNSSN